MNRLQDKMMFDLIWLCRDFCLQLFVLNIHVITKPHATTFQTQTQTFSSLLVHSSFSAREVRICGCMLRASKMGQTLLWSCNCISKTFIMRKVDMIFHFWQFNYVLSSSCRDSDRVFLCLRFHEIFLNLLSFKRLKDRKLSMI